MNARSSNRVAGTALALLTAGLWVATPASADDYPRDWNVDVLHYRFALELSDRTDAIRGEAAITVRFVSAGVREISFDLVGRRPGGEQGMQITAVRRQGEPVGFNHAGDRVTLSLVSASAAEERRTFTISYEGVAADGLIVDENMFGDRTFFGDNWPDRARHWLPTVDHVSDKATVDWIITAPAHYQVVATGSLVERTDLDGGSRRTHWRTTVPIPPKVMVMGAARFAVQHLGTIAGVPLQSWVYPQSRDAGFHDYAVAARVLRFFAGHIGPFPYEKLANVQSKTRYGGMENASNIFYAEFSVSGTRASESLIAHEVAHQWFGDSVTERDWHHLWLSEGFATYFTQLYNEFTYGRDAMERGMREARDTVVAFHQQSPELALIAEQLVEPIDMLNRNAYQKGAWVLHMLRRRLGDDVFWEGIREYYRRYRDGNALTEDLQRVMEEISGQELGAFFAQWAYRPGHPVLEASWSFDPDSGRLTLEVAQVGSETPFDFPLDIGISTADAPPTRIETVDVAAAVQTFSFEVGSMPTAVTLDPETWLLFEGRLAPGRTAPAR